jgi:hypothetical protein
MEIHRRYMENMMCLGQLVSTRPTQLTTNLPHVLSTLPPTVPNEMMMMMDDDEILMTWMVFVVVVVLVMMEGVPHIY